MAPHATHGVAIGAAAQHAQLQEQNRQLEQQLLSTRNQLRLAQEEHAAQLSCVPVVHQHMPTQLPLLSNNRQLERTSLEQRERRERLHQEQIAAAVSRALEDGLQAHMDAATRRVLEDGARLAQEVAHARAEAARVQAQATRLQEENRRLQGCVDDFVDASMMHPHAHPPHTVLASVEQDTEAQLAARAAALSDALQGTLQQAANTEWRVLDCGAALHEASERLAAALAQAEAARQEGLVHQAEAARLAAELDASRCVLGVFMLCYAMITLGPCWSMSRARMAAMMQHCDAVTRFLLQCTEDLALTEGAVAGRVEGGHVVPSARCWAGDQRDVATFHCPRSFAGSQCNTAQSCVAPVAGQAGGLSSACSGNRGRPWPRTLRYDTTSAIKVKIAY